MGKKPKSPVARFGAFEMRLDTGELFKNGRRLAIQEQPFRVLAVLIERPGEMVTREELRQRVWPAETFVEFDQGLNVAVHKLRATLADSTEKPRYVETLAGRGYRFIARVSRTQSSSGGNFRPALRWVACIGAVLLLALAGFWNSWQSPRLGRKTVAVLPLRPVSTAQQQRDADAMTYALIAALADCGSLRVVSATSSEKFRGSAKSLPEIARELGVDAVLEGAYAGTDRNISITAQLIDASRDRSLWGGHFERLAASPPAQAELAGIIARNVKFALLRPGETPPGENGTFFTKPAATGPLTRRN